MIQILIIDEITRIFKLNPTMVFSPMAVCLMTGINHNSAKRVFQQLDTKGIIRKIIPGYYRKN